MARSAASVVRKHFDNDLHKAFRTLDVDRSNCLDAQELGTAICKFDLASGAMCRWWARRALELLAGSRDGCVTDVRVLAGLGMQHSFSTEPWALPRDEL